MQVIIIEEKKETKKETKTKTKEANYKLSPNQQLPHHENNHHAHTQRVAHIEVCRAILP